MINKTLAIAYFSKLLNFEIDENTLIKLSSGQRVRAASWLKANGFSIEILRRSTGFTISQLSNEIDSNWGAKDFRDAVNADDDKSNFSNSANYSIGIDIQSISELFPAGLTEDPKSEAELLSMFTLREITYAQSKFEPERTLTGIFAAKEAAQKCMRNNIDLIELEVLPDINGKPHLNGYLISISHSLDFAIAIAMPIEKSKKQATGILGGG